MSPIFSTLPLLIMMALLGGLVPARDEQPNRSNHMVLKLGSIGLKGHVGTVLAGVKQLGDVEVVAVSEDDPKLLASLMQREPLLKNAQVYTQWRQLVEHTQMDVCCVADESGVRLEQLFALMQRGVHIVSEKPLATTSADLERLRPPEAKTSSDDRLRVIGTKGVIEVNEGDETISLITGDKTERIPFGETENLFVEFVNFLRGGPSPRITVDDCFYITEAVLLARAAADELKLITLPPPHPVRGSK